MSLTHTPSFCSYSHYPGSGSDFISSDLEYCSISKIYSSLCLPPAWSPVLPTYSKTASQVRNLQWVPTAFKFMSKPPGLGRFQKETQVIFPGMAPNMPLSKLFNPDMQMCSSFSMYSLYVENVRTFSSLQPWVYTRLPFGFSLSPASKTGPKFTKAQVRVWKCSGYLIWKLFMKVITMI